MSIGLQHVNGCSARQLRKVTHGMKEIDLTPFKRCLWTICGIGRTWLHTLDVTNMLDLVNWAVAAMIAARKCSWEEGSDAANESERLQHDGGVEEAQFFFRCDYRGRESQVLLDHANIWRTLKEPRPCLICQSHLPRFLADKSTPSIAPIPSHALFQEIRHMRECQCSASSAQLRV